MAVVELPQVAARPVVAEVQPAQVEGWRAVQMQERVERQPELGPEQALAEELPRVAAPEPVGAWAERGTRIMPHPLQDLRFPPLPSQRRVPMCPHHRVRHHNLLHPGHPRTCPPHDLLFLPPSVRRPVRPTGIARRVSAPHAA